MQQSITLKPHDIAVLVKLLTKSNDEWRQVDLAMELEISQGEIAKSLSRLNQAGLVTGKRPNLSASIELLIHGFKYVFPAELGPIAIGVPTGISAPTHEKLVVQNGEDFFVWPSSKGNRRGQIIKPLYPKLAQAAINDKKFYELMSALEIIRIGRSRERKLAEEFLIQRIKQK